MTPTHPEIPQDAYFSTRTRDWFKRAFAAPTAAQATAWPAIAAGQHVAIKERLGTLDPERLAELDLEPAFKEKPAVHRFPGSMAQRVQAAKRIHKAEWSKLKPRR